MFKIITFCKNASTCKIHLCSWYVTTGLFSKNVFLAHFVRYSFESCINCYVLIYGFLLSVFKSYSSSEMSVAFNIE